ncbi:MAG: class I SAM-dependent methyltransferase [Ignavibacteria bacterium]|nr:class I SAM-dependent methyltransferase [Ignavibacteria bacterium]
MPGILEYIINRIADANAVSAKKLRKNYKKFSAQHIKDAEEFLDLYSVYLSSISKDIDYAAECYLKMTGDMFLERMRFLETGEYSNKLYKDVDEKIYSNPEIMDYHMHGLALGQFLWPDQYIRYRFFSDNLLKYEPVKSYLEIGGGHGLYVREAVKQLRDRSEFTVIDISQSSLNICENMSKGENVKFILKDIFDYHDSDKFDFITVGEVIEHLEDPLKLLKKIHSILNDNGTVYLTTPVNAPMIDHIYLFNNVNEIKELLHKAEFKIAEDVHAYSEDLPEALAIEHKIPLMYACFLKKV